MMLSHRSGQQRHARPPGRARYSRAEIMATATLLTLTQIVGMKRGVFAASTVQHYKCSSIDAQLGRNSYYGRLQP